MKYYKLTDENGQTRNGKQWGENITHHATGSGLELCSDGFIHFYCDPLIAVLMNPIHADFKNPQLWECDVAGEVLHKPLKSGAKTVTTKWQLPLPDISTVQKQAFGILSAKQVEKDKDWLVWADKWLCGIDRTYASAAAAVAYYASDASDASALASYAASYAAYAASDASVAAAASDASAVDNHIDFIALAKEAMTIE